MDEINNERKKAFTEFIHSLPRLCSPTICGLLDSSQTLSSDEVCAGQTSDDQIKFPPTVSAPDPLGNNFNWTIDEYAELYGSDFSNVDELEEFEQLDAEISEKLEIENNKFFSQSLINSSPLLETSRKNLTSIDQLTSRSRNTGSFILYIDKLKELQDNESRFKFDDDDDDEVDERVQSVDLSHQKVYSPMDIDFVQKTPISKNKIQSETNSVDKMEISYHRKMINSFDYLNFSPISPIGIRNNYLTINRTSGLNHNLMTPGLKDLNDISPILPPSSTKTNRVFVKRACNIGWNKENLITPPSKFSQAISPMSVDEHEPSNIQSSATEQNNLNISKPHSTIFQDISNEPNCCNQIKNFKTPQTRLLRSRTKILFNEMTSTPNYD